MSRIPSPRAARRAASRSGHGASGLPRLRTMMGVSYRLSTHPSTPPGATPSGAPIPLRVLSWRHQAAQDQVIRDGFILELLPDEIAQRQGTVARANQYVVH